MLKVHRQSADPPEANITIWNIHFDGTSAGRPLAAAAISVEDSSKVVIAHNRIDGARKFGVTVSNSSNTTIKFLSLEMVRSSSGEPEGGAGVWNRQSSRLLRFARLRQALQGSDRPDQW
jgi:parallel beta-helix repeat protein